MSRAAPALLVLVLSGCAGAFLEIDPNRGAPAAPQSYWRPPSDFASELERPPDTLPVPPQDAIAELRDAAEAPDLATLVQIALANNPTTRASWAEARAQAAAAGIARGAFYPSLTLGGDITLSKGIGTSGAEAFDETTYGPSATLSYLLFDFGGRAASAEAALQSLIAANWQHNQAILDVVLDVAENYYTLTGAEALVAAGEESLKDANGSVAAAKARMKAEIGTAFDYLQAETTAAELELEIEADRGAAETARGELAQSLGLPASFPIRVRPPAGSPDPGAATASVDDLIALARERRPDLAAAWASFRESEANVRVAWSNLLPKVSANATIQRLYLETEAEREGGATSIDANGWPYDASIAVTAPLFDGFQLVNQLREARADAEAQRAELASQDQQVMADVWTSFTSLETARATLRTSEKLLDAAQQSFKAARVAYDNGLGNIIELLDAQIALASAREQKIEAETDWYVALAELAHDVGLLTRELSPDELLQRLRP